MNIETLAHHETTIRSCPALVTGVDGDPEPCGRELVVIQAVTTLGDDYGAWDSYAVSFECGHTLGEMATGLNLWSLL